MLLNLTDRQLQTELGIADAPTRQLILQNIEQLRSKPRLGSIGSVAPPSATGRPYHSELVDQVRQHLNARGFTADPSVEQSYESTDSQSLPYTRSQLLFMLGERNRLIGVLYQENQELRQRLQIRAASSS